MHCIDDWDDKISVNPLILCLTPLIFLCTLFLRLFASYTTLWKGFSVNQTADLPLGINCDVSSLVLKVNL